MESFTLVINTCYCNLFLSYDESQMVSYVQPMSQLQLKFLSLAFLLHLLGNLTLSPSYSLQWRGCVFEIMQVRSFRNLHLICCLGCVIGSWAYWIRSQLKKSKCNGMNDKLVVDGANGLGGDCSWTGSRETIWDFLQLAFFLLSIDYVVFFSHQFAIIFT